MDNMNVLDKISNSRDKRSIKRDKQDLERSELGDDDVSLQKLQPMQINKNDRVQSIVSQYNLTGPPKNWN